MTEQDGFARSLYFMGQTKGCYLRSLKYLLAVESGKVLWMEHVFHGFGWSMYLYFMESSEIRWSRNKPHTGRLRQT